MRNRVLVSVIGKSTITVVMGFLLLIATGIGALGQQETRASLVLETPPCGGQNEENR
jgi:hypothetical protein